MATRFAKETPERIYRLDSANWMSLMGNRDVTEPPPASLPTTCGRSPIWRWPTETIWLLGSVRPSVRACAC
jgi:hypothetical protein